MMLPAAWQRISALSSNSSKVQAISNAQQQQQQQFGNNPTMFSSLGSRKSSLSSLSLASFASSDTSFTAISYTSHHYVTATVNPTSRAQQLDSEQQIFEVATDDDDFNVDLEDAGGCCGTSSANYNKLDCVIEENL